MHNVFKLAAVAALCSTAVAAHAELSLDANLELDTTYTNAYGTAANELYRDEIRSALQTW